MATRSHSVAEMAAATLGDPSAKERVGHMIADRRLIKQLIILRHFKKITQKQIADHMGCDTSKISKIEAGFDSNLKFGDILGYVTALGLGFVATLTDPSTPIAGQIKAHVFRIDALLKELSALAAASGNDRAITEGIDRFYKEVLFNFLKNFKDQYGSFLSCTEIDFGEEEEKYEAEESIEDLVHEDAAVAVT